MRREGWRKKRQCRPIHRKRQHRVSRKRNEDDDGELGRATTLSPPTPTPTPAMKQIFSFPISSLPAPPRDRQLTVIEAPCERITEAPDTARCRRYCLSSGMARSSSGGLRGAHPFVPALRRVPKSD